MTMTAQQKRKKIENKLPPEEWVALKAWRTPEELAIYLEIGRTTIYRRIKSGEINVMGAIRPYKISQSELKRYMGLEEDSK